MPDTPNKPKSPSLTVAGDDVTPLRPIPPPSHPLFLIHFLLVLPLLIYFPFSKLLHAGGIFFSPSRNQPYEIQKPGKRYVNQGNYPIQY